MARLEHRSAKLRAASLRPWVELESSMAVTADALRRRAIRRGRILRPIGKRQRFSSTQKLRVMLSEAKHLWLSSLRACLQRPEILRFAQADGPGSFRHDSHKIAHRLLCWN